MKKMKRIAAALLAVGVVTAASAGSIELETTPTINLNAGCEVNILGGNTVDFGAVHNFTRASEVAPVTKTVSVACTNGLPYTLGYSNFGLQIPEIGESGGVVPFRTDTDEGLYENPYAETGKGSVADEFQITFKIRKQLHGGTYGVDFEPTEHPFMSTGAGAISYATSNIVVAW